MRSVEQVELRVCRAAIRVVLLRRSDTGLLHNGGLPAQRPTAAAAAEDQLTRALQVCHEHLSMSSVACIEAALLVHLVTVHAPGTRAQHALQYSRYIACVIHFLCSECARGPMCLALMCLLVRPHSVRYGTHMPRKVHICGGASTSHDLEVTLKPRLQMIIKAVGLTATTWYVEGWL